MIFVTVGTNEAPFDRLLHAIEGLCLEEELVVQHGSSRIRPAQASCFDFLPFELLTDHVRRARVVVTHAGVGSIIVCLASGKQPIVVPRLKRFGEAVDDHQLVFGKRFAESGLVRLAEHRHELESLLSADVETGMFQGGKSGRLVEEIRAFLAECVGEGAHYRAEHA
jgi:UDP-N-acetylglucosamine transferase subunit ALG13